jgi:hypothetical protein
MTSLSNTYGSGWMIASRGGTYDEAKQLGNQAVKGFDERIIYGKQPIQKGEIQTESGDDWIGHFAGGTDGGE